ncbi:MAG TPA: UvrD-helicase domain-containing protein, partial [Jiangellaceae bacterium]|nr:UvrD-helicase domain-containing protein [Jiangellaceae bacterium]
MSALFNDLQLSAPHASDGGTGERRRTDPETVLEGLNPPQREAVMHSGSPLLIVAGAGSGKTRVLTRRIAYLLAERNVHPGSILAITFTNKAAGEMKERVAQLVGKRANIMWVSTFHSACVRILRKEAKRFGFTSSFSIYDQADSQRLMTLVCRELDLDPRRYQPRQFSHQVSNFKNELIDYETALARAENHHQKMVAQAYELYQKRLTEANAMDFDDLIMLTVHLLQAFPDVAENYRRRFRHVLVDEYQDTNHAQYVLVRELVGTTRHDHRHGTKPKRTVDGDLVNSVAGDDRSVVEPAELCVVGDADQSIYAFRGATIRNILQFEKDYPDAKVVLLEQNYRSTQTILAAANAVISKNPERKPKRLWTDAGDGSPIVGYVADNEHAEAQFVAEEIDKLGDDGEAKSGDVAVFYRTNAQSRVMEDALRRANIPYLIVGGVRFYERREIRDVVAYLRLVVNPFDDVAFRRAVAAQENRPAQPARLVLAGRAVVRDLALLPEDMKEPLVEWRSLEIVLDEAALLAHTAKVASVTLQAPVVRATRRGDGSFAGAAAFGTATDAEPAAKPPAAGPSAQKVAPVTVTIGQLRIKDGAAHLHD